MDEAVRTRRRRRIWWGVMVAALLATTVLTVVAHPFWFLAFCAMMGTSLRAATRTWTGVEDDPGYDDHRRGTLTLPPGLWPFP